MYAKKIKRKCGVRGCKNTVSYAISKSREMGNSIIACKECLLEALAKIEELNKPIAENFPEAEVVDEVVSEVVSEAPTETEKPKTTRQRKK